jgi:hypothetical protein
MNTASLLALVVEIQGAAVGEINSSFRPYKIVVENHRLRKPGYF